MTIANVKFSLMRRALAAGALIAVFVLGAWMGPGLAKARDEFLIGKSDVRCLPSSNICIGAELARTHIRRNSQLSLETVICPEAHMGVNLPAGIQTGVCRGSVTGLSFSRGGRWYIVNVHDGRIVSVEDGPQMGWAL